MKGLKALIILVIAAILLLARSGNLGLLIVLLPASLVIGYGLAGWLRPKSGLRHSLKRG